MIARALIVACLVGGAGLFAYNRSGPEARVERQTLDDMPFTIEGWSGAQAAPFADDVVAQLGVDDYIHRTYQQGAGVPVSVYIGYYDSQRQGDTIHSPQNCLPGAGWRPIDSGTETIAHASGAATVNRYIIAKGLDRQVVLYWYQGRGRVIANEYANKALLMFDAARLRRTNGGLVRLITPVATTTDDAMRRATTFAASLLPQLPRYLP